MQKKLFLIPLIILPFLLFAIYYYQKKPPQIQPEIKYPSQLLNLTNWKLTIPAGKSKKPIEITQPSLSKYISEPYFNVIPEKGVIFRAPVNGVSTKGSDYPRSELREMTNEGKDLANWSTTSGTHIMFLEQSITSVPKTKSHVVAGQIHDENDDVIVVRLEYPKLFIDINGKAGPVLDENYSLGKRFTVKFISENGEIKVYYNENQNPAYTLEKKSAENYFKAGVYTQSNCSKEKDCSDGNYGEVVIYLLKVEHYD